MGVDNACSYDKYDPSIITGTAVCIENAGKKGKPSTFETKCMANKVLNGHTLGSEISKKKYLYGCGCCDRQEIMEYVNAADASKIKIKYENQAYCPKKVGIISSLYEHSVCATTVRSCGADKKSGEMKYPVCYMYKGKKEKTQCIETNKLPGSSYEFKHCGCCSSDPKEYCD